MLLVINYCSVCLTWLTTLWKRGIHANIRKRNVKKSAIIEATSLWVRCVIAAEWKAICSNAVNAQRERNIDTVTSQRTPSGLCVSALDLSLRLYCDYVRYFILNVIIQHLTYDWQSQLVRLIYDDHERTFSLQLPSLWVPHLVLMHRLRIIHALRHGFKVTNFK